MDCTQMNIYAGVWGGGTGTIWWDDIKIEQPGLMNVLRRPGAPLHVQNKRTGQEYTEGKDFLPVTDSIMLKGDGSYTYHVAPTFKRIISGAIKNGDSLAISFFHPVTVYGDENGVGSNMVCISEPATDSILHRQMREVTDLYHPGHILMSHDEIRAMNTDSSCLKRHLSPAEILSDNANRCYDYLKQLDPNSNIYIWSDMFDSLHNAHDNYYLVNGDLTGSWNLLNNNITIMDWYLGKSHETLPKFASLGFKQMTSPYYDERGTNSIRLWRIATEGIPNIEGSMYTTWTSDYDYLTPFADYAWSAGPFLVHKPLDSTARQALKSTGSYKLEAWVYSDPYDKTDKITSVSATLEGSATETVTLTDEGNGHYTGLIHTIPTKGYIITAKNSQGFVRVTPKYILPDNTSSVGSQTVTKQTLTLYPNPVTNSSTLSFTSMGTGAWHAVITDELGKESISQHGVTGHLPQAQSINISKLRAGNYFLRVYQGEEVSLGRFSVLPAKP